MARGKPRRDDDEEDGRWSKSAERGEEKLDGERLWTGKMGESRDMIAKGGIEDVEKRGWEGIGDD